MLITNCPWFQSLTSDNPFMCVAPSQKLQSFVSSRLSLSVTGKAVFLVCSSVRFQEKDVFLSVCTFRRFESSRRCDGVRLHVREGKGESGGGRRVRTSRGRGRRELEDRGAPGQSGSEGSAAGKRRSRISATGRSGRHRRCSRRSVKAGSRVWRRQRKTRKTGGNALMKDGKGRRGHAPVMIRVQHDLRTLSTGMFGKIVFRERGCAVEMYGGCVRCGRGDARLSKARLKRDLIGTRCG